MYRLCASISPAWSEESPVPLAGSGERAHRSRRSSWAQHGRGEDHDDRRNWLPTMPQGEKRRQVALVTLDTYRIAAVEQLRLFCQNYRSASGYRAHGRRTGARSGTPP